MQESLFKDYESEDEELLPKEGEPLFSDLVNEEDKIELEPYYLTEEEKEGSPEVIKVGEPSTDDLFERYDEWIEKGEPSVYTDKLTGKSVGLSGVHREPRPSVITNKIIALLTQSQKPLEILSALVSYYKVDPKFFKHKNQVAARIGHDKQRISKKKVN